ncbi:hypothetical protein NDU88_007112, partial [Pleurodeles waltl]
VYCAASVHQTQCVHNLAGNHYKPKLHCNRLPQPLVFRESGKLSVDLFGVSYVKGLLQLALHFW